MSNVTDITAANPVIAMLEDIKKAVLRDSLTSCVIILVEDGEPFTVSMISEDDGFMMIGVLEQTKLEILNGEHL